MSNSAVKPALELRSIKVISSMSEETNCYQAKLYVDGQHFADVSNRGHGGCDDVYLANGKTHADLHNLELLIKNTFEPYRCGESSIDYNLEMACGDLVDAWLLEKDCKRILKKPTYLKDGNVMQFSLRKGEKLDAVIAAIKAKRPEISLLNCMPESEAIAALKVALA
jgi:hypothetical protein